MVILVIGGSGSGKSEYAESRCMQFCQGEKLYIATMEPYGKEGQARIARHHRLRQGKGFDTLECYTHLEEAAVPAGKTVLLECMSNLTANELFSPTGRKEAAAEVIGEGVRRLIRLAGHTVIVTNEVFSDGMTYDAETEHYRAVMAQVNRDIARLADEVIEVVHGIPVFVKGGENAAAWEDGKR